MLWMIIFWGSLVVSFIIVLINKNFKNRKLTYFGGLFIVYSIIAFLMGIAMNDPVFEPLGIPKDYEWLFGMLLIGFASWQYYFNPIKERIMRVEMNFAPLSSEIKSIKEDLKIIKDRILTKN